MHKALMEKARMHSVALEAPDDFAGWRVAARALVIAGIAPEHVSWSSPADPPALLAGPPPPEAPEDAPAPRVPQAFPELAELVIRHRDPGRFALLHRLLHRLQAALPADAVLVEEAPSHRPAIQAQMPRNRWGSFFTLLLRVLLRSSRRWSGKMVQLLLLC